MMLVDHEDVALGVFQFQLCSPQRAARPTHGLQLMEIHCGTSIVACHDLPSKQGCSLNG